ncbi:BTB/POZ domain-containing protein 17 [Thrips palmi]|uniref:BTB/POZ domain-containing protein 17 n=1 Tax=Thrips palmi TaxID=161013 RepID=A0A6P8Y715_THRPL|nr:BTB/POZ domain-containing protein 17 [Thrips palmi]XP_034235413.1 BTB/POZ domain-containing protein 17 [Thrips palmi]XP_034235414.1 BTB/POZ domain-containing protein 17 [Thrips palmi]XP_034235415.1 BTB/POZ domain-containing protein 17 [Thrips palmi]
MFWHSDRNSSSSHQTSSSKMDDKGPPLYEEGNKFNTAEIEIDNSRAVLNNISLLHTDRVLSDVCLIVGGKEYPAHRLILCASSEVFRVMLTSPQWSECKESRVNLGETPACAEVFDRFLQYFYTGHICVDAQIVMPILTLADKYNLKDLTVVCQKYMYQHVQYAATTNQLVAWHQYTQTCGHTEVAKKCKDFIKWNLQLIAQTPDFGNFEPDILIDILQQDDIVVVDEMTLLQYVVRWVNYQRYALFAEAGYILDEEDGEIWDIDPKTLTDVNNQIKDLVCRVITHIRFPMMSPTQLASLLIEPLVQEFKEFFVQRMAIGMSYHADQRERIEDVCINDEAGCSLFTPRLYTSECWSMLLPVENYLHLPPYQLRSHVFSSHTALADHKGHRTCEWAVDIYPKGVWFQKFYSIVWQGMEEVPEVVLRTVRVSITCKEPPPEGDMRVKVGILVHGMRNDVEHIMQTVVCIHRFDNDNKVLNLDDVVSFDKLNRDLASGDFSPNHPSTSKSFTQTGNCHSQHPSPYLVGPNRDVLKIHVVIAPMEQVCNPSLLLRRNKVKSS